MGCAKKEPNTKPPLSEAQKNFEKKCREDFDLQVVTRTVGQTIYAYLPTDKPMFDYEAQKENTETAQAKTPKFSVQYADGEFKGNAFNFEYDIIKKTKSSKEDYGYNTAYTDAYIKMQNNLFTAMAETFADVPLENPAPKEAVLKFFVVVITDIKKGMETRSTIYWLDFKRYMAGDLPYDEYMKRFLSDVKGGQSMIGDETGSHIDYKDIRIEDFLTKQIINRIHFKFERSDFQPPDDYDSTIADIVADTTRYYKFTAFEALRLENLRSNKKLLFDATQLASFGDDKDFKDGKLIHIIFENGKATFPDEKK